MKKHRLSIILFITLIILGIISLFIGVIDISVSDIFKSREVLQIFIKSRIPRLLAIIITGVGMSISGLIMQKLCANKFVSPTTSTTLSGAKLGLLIAIIFVPSGSLIQKSLISFSISILCTLIFVFFITRIKLKSSIMVPLIGIMMGNIILGFSNFLAFKTNTTQIVTTYFTGNFSSVVSGKYEIVFLVLPLIIIAYIFSGYFNIVGMGKDFSKNLGVNYNFILILGLIICALITSSIVVVVGAISYIGLIVPNIISIFKGDKIKTSILETGLLGALMVLICDIFSRIIIFPYELPVELVLGVVGSILFIILIFIKLKNIKFKRVKISEAKN